MKRILVIEDDLKVAQSIRQGLEEEGYAASMAITGEEGFFLVTTQGFDLVILDLMLPGRSGLEERTGSSKLLSRGTTFPITHDCKNSGWPNLYPIG